VWTLLDNAHGAVQGHVVLEARRLSDGHVLERWTKNVELRPGDRGVSIEAQVSQFSAPDTLLSASFLGTRSVRLLSEPKHAKANVPRLSVSRQPGGILLETDRPVLDLFLWDADDQLELLDNFVTLPAAGQVFLRARGSWTRLLGRSLAGRHVIHA